MVRNPVREGNGTINLPDDACILVQKCTEDGYLMIQIIEDAHGIFNSTHEYRRLETTAPYGALEACVERR